MTQAEQISKLLENSQKQSETIDKIIGRVGDGRRKFGQDNSSGWFSDFLGGGVKSNLGSLTQSALTAGITQTSGLEARERFGIESISKGVTELFKMKNVADLVTGAMNGLISIADQIVLQYEQESQLLTDINEKAGLTGELSRNLREEIMAANPAIINMGYGFRDLSKFYTDLIEKTGKFTMLNRETLARTAQVSRAFVGDLSQMAETFGQFEKVGMGAENTLEAINEVGVESLSLGLRSKKTVSDITTSIEKLNQYGFENGVRGLAEMSRKATEFRMSMDSVFGVAEKVFSAEGAIDLSAKLQVLGGAMNEFGDPLKLMYMATNNVEGLQDAILGASKSLATYNNEQGRFEVTGANLRIAKDMAGALGMELSDLSRTAIATAERTKAASELLSTGLQMDDKDREFLTNLGHMKDGRMVISVPESLAKKLGSQTEIAVGDMTESIKRGLLANKEAFEKKDARDLAMDQLTVMGKMERHLNTMAAVARNQLGTIIKESTVGVGFQKMTQDLSDWTQGLTDQMLKQNTNLKSQEGEELKKYVLSNYGESGWGKVEEMYNKLLSENKKTQQTQQPTETRSVNETRVSGNVHITSDSAVDAISKQIFKDPRIERAYQNDITRPRLYI